MSNEKIGVDPNELINLTLTVSQLTVIMEVLHNGSYKMVKPTIDSLQTQVQTHFTKKRAIDGVESDDLKNNQENDINTSTNNRELHKE